MYVISIDIIIVNRQDFDRQGDKKMVVNESMYQLGSVRSAIRELFEYGKKRAAIVGKENVYDFSIGNPSIPDRKSVV